MPRRIDLHTHSTHSDGTSSPSDVVRIAHRSGVTLLLLTDHDSVGGFEEASEEAGKLGLPFACGVEINTREDDMVHVLGYGIDPGCEALLKGLEDFRGRRKKRAAAILEKLRKQGIDISMEDVVCESQEALGRPHIADALRRKKIVRSRQEAFTKYLAKGAAAYVDPLGPSTQEAIALIKSAGGWASLAHPFTCGYEEKLEAWVAAGLGGLEAYYRTHTGPQTIRLLQAARLHGLRVTGGSDYHGPGTGREQAGGVEVPDEVFEELVEALGLKA